MHSDQYAPKPAHLQWLLDSDPAIRWQVMRDILDATPEGPEAGPGKFQRRTSAFWPAQPQQHDTASRDQEGGFVPDFAEIPVCP